MNWNRVTSIICFGLTLGCQSAPKSVTPSNRKLTRLTEVVGAQASDSLNEVSPVIDSIHATPEQLSTLQVSVLANPHWGYALFDPEKNRVLDSVRAETQFMPASVIKVLTGVAALSVLGPDYRFSTRLRASGMIVAGELRGDLILQGTGDPRLSVADLMNLAGALRRQGIKRVAGKFYLDESFFPTTSMIESRWDLSERYNPGVSALSAEFNQFSLNWRSGASPGEIEVFATPEMPQLELRLSDESVAEETASPMEPEFHAFEGGRSVWYFPRSGPEEGKTKLPVRDAGLYVGQIFRSLARMQGIEVPEPTRAITLPRVGKILATHESEPLSQLVETNLEYSNNLMSELIGMTTARKLERRALSLPASAQRIEEWYRAELPELRHSRFRMLGSSGLDSENRASPRDLVRVLAYADKMKAATPSFVSLLPVGGMKGTLARRFEEPEMAMRVWAKTGAVSFGGGLAGYVFTKSGRKLIFAILGTDPIARKRYEIQARAAAKQGAEFRESSDPRLAKEARTWAKQFRSIQDELLREWVRRY